MSAAALVLATLLLAPAAATAASKEQQLLMAELRMMQQNQQLLQQSLIALADTLKVVTGRLDDQAAIHVYRVLQESLANVARHSGSQHATVRLRSSGQLLELEVEDHGRGFPPGESRRGLGLVAMRERAALVGGTLDVSEAPGGGTLVRLTVPTGARGAAL